MASRARAVPARSLPKGDFRAPGPGPVALRPRRHPCDADGSNLPSFSRGDTLCHLNPPTRSTRPCSWITSRPLNNSGRRSGYALDRLCQWPCLGEALSKHCPAPNHQCADHRVGEGSFNTTRMLAWAAFTGPFPREPQALGVHHSQ